MAVCNFPTRTSSRAHELETIYRQHLYAGDVAPCVYCGAASCAIDHIPPQHTRSQLIALNVKFDAIELPVCTECNSILGAKSLWRVSERRKYVKQQLRKRYAHLLKMPDWSEEELAELAPGMQQYIRNGLMLRQFIRDRLAWQGSDYGYLTQVQLPNAA